MPNRPTVCCTRRSLDHTFDEYFDGDSRRAVLVPASEAHSPSKRKRGVDGAADAAGATPTQPVAPAESASVVIDDAVIIGSQKLTLGVGAVDMTDSTTAYLAGDWPLLRARLDSDGFLLVRGVIPRPTVQRAREAVLQHLHAQGALLVGSPMEEARAEYEHVWRQQLGAATASQRRTAAKGRASLTSLLPGWVVYADSGDVVDGRDPGDSAAGWRAVGSSAALVGVYSGVPLAAFCQQLFESDAARAQRALPAAAASPPAASFTALTEHTWLRAKGPGEATQVHVDYFYFYRQQHVYRDYWPTSPVSASAASSQPSSHACELCRAAGSEHALRCALCGRGYHMQCLRPRLKLRPRCNEDWHCYACTNLPMAHWTCWLPLGDLTRADGRLALVAGSHRSVGGYETEAVRGQLPGGWTAEAKAAAVWQVPASIDMGDLIIFNCKTVHAATPNHPNRFRLSVDTRVTTGTRR